MKSRFDSKAEAEQYAKDHQLTQQVPFPLVGTTKWGLAYPLEAHVTVIPHTLAVEMSA